jgi:hypothetical protein
VVAGTVTVKVVIVKLLPEDSGDLPPPS